MDALRPAVHCQTIKYGRRLRAGRGFSLLELKTAGINRNYARTIGIAVDLRRKNSSQESVDRNVARLKEYMSRVIVFPRPGKGRRLADAPADVIASVDVATAPRKHPMAVVDEKVNEAPRAITEEDTKFSVYKTLRIERKNQRQHGIRARRAADKAAKAKASKKK